MVRGSDATPTFEKRRLSDEYWAEGASAGDFDGDGALDVVCGPWWWKGPKLEERHRIYDGKAFPNDRG
ncbi:MAG TPA: hypothetical protein VK116_15060, partial [Planctomycetota bacterium]|nr:hypothetical protein [Planctomycetota bacterium]